MDKEPDDWSWLAFQNEETGELPGERLGISPLAVPVAFELENGYLKFLWQAYNWDFISGRTSLDRKASANGALDRFVRLKTPRQVLSFAERYGPLRLCEAHSQPLSHDPMCFKTYPTRE